MIYWFTGQPCAGKTVLADILKEHLPNAFRIDGDEMRALFANQDYSINGRVMNVGTAQKIAHYLHNLGRGVGYDSIEHYPPDDIKSISATKIREQMKKDGKL